MATSSRPGPNNLSLQQLADGVFATFILYSNAGLIDLGGQVVVFDSLQTPQMAQDLRQSAFDLFGPTKLIRAPAN
jgi:cyclase